MYKYVFVILWLLLLLMLLFCKFLEPNSIVWKCKWIAVWVLSRAINRERLGYTVLVGRFPVKACPFCLQSISTYVPPNVPSMRWGAVPGTVTPTGATLSYASHCQSTPEPFRFKNDYISGGKINTLYRVLSYQFCLHNTQLWRLLIIAVSSLSLSLFVVVVVVVVTETQLISCHREVCVRTLWIVLY